MEDSDSPQSVQPAQEPKVGFPGPSKKKKGIKPVWVILLFVFLVVAGLIFYLAFFAGEKSYSIESDVTPTIEQVTETPTPTDAATKAKDELTVSVLNGTGISGEAGVLKTRLESLGFENITADNADDTGYVDTEVYLSSEVSLSVKQELVTELEKIYQSVEVQEVSSPTVDVRIIIGYKKGASATATPRPTSAATPKPTSAATPTPTSGTINTPTSTL